MFEQIREARVAVEALPRSQTDEDLARTPLQPRCSFTGSYPASKTNKGTAPSVGDRPSKALTCSVATMFVSRSGWTRKTFTGAVQLTRTKPS